MKEVKIESRKIWEKQISRKDSVLDIGCWSGSKVLSLYKKCNAYGTDFNKETLEQADEKIKNKLVYCDITKNKPFDKKFDWVLMSEVIEHIEKEKDALRNVSTSIKKGGKLILTTPRSIPFFQFWDPAWIRWKFFWGNRHYHYNLNELKNLLEKEGFKIKEYTIAGPFKWVFARWINIVLKFVLKSKKTISFGQGNGFCNWMILAEKIK